jgi:hypothetical protein
MPSTPSEALLDVNVIIASVFADHVMHRSARRFVEGAGTFSYNANDPGRIPAFCHPPMEE